MPRLPVAASAGSSWSALTGIGDWYPSRGPKWIWLRDLPPATLAANP